MRRGGAPHRRHDAVLVSGVVHPIAGPTAAAALLALLPAGAWGEGTSPPLLTRIRDVRSLSPEEAARRHPVRLRGTVTYLDEDNPAGLIVHDGEVGQFVLYAEPFFRTHPRIALRAGDRVEVEGHTVEGGFAPNVMPALVRRLGPGTLPDPQRLPYTALLTGRHDCAYVEISGVGQRAWPAEPPAGGLFVEVAVEGGIVRASLRDVRPGDRERFVDARLRLRGNVGALFGQAGQLRGVSLLGGRTADVVVEDPPPPAFSLPARSIASLYRYSAGGEMGRRIRVRGVVTGGRVGLPVEVHDFTTGLRYRDVRHVFYVRDETGAARIETSEDTRLQAGDVVDVAGFPAVTPTKPVLLNATQRTVGTATVPAASPLSTTSPLAPERDAELVTTRAQVLGLVASPTERALVLQMGETPFEAVLDAANAPGGLGDLSRGSLVSVTGIYSYQGGPPPSFRLLLRSPQDVTLIRAAPWWTLRHTAVVGVLVAVVALAAAWQVRMMASRHQLEREQDRAIFAERSRLARELHDTVEQGLAGIKLQLEAVAGSLDASPDAARRALQVAGEMLGYSMEEARRSVLDLRPQALEDHDLGSALSDLARRMTDGTPLHAEVRVSGDPIPLDASVEHHLFRIGMEALTNAIKHSGARHIDIGLSYGREAADLVVSDDGSGFPHPSTEVAGEHFGLRGIRERVDKLGGALSVESRREGGTRLAVSVPARPAPAQGAARG
jgi:signal transduction histidine kinase